MTVWKALRRISLTQWILIAIAAGILIGWLLGPQAETYCKPLATVFLRMIKLLIVPLLFSTLVVGIAGHSDDLAKVGRLAVRSLLYFLFATSLALVVGLAAANMIRPGEGVALQSASEATSAAAIKGKKLGEELEGKAITFEAVLNDLVPTSFFDAAAGNKVLQIVFFTVLFAAALTQISAPRRKVMIEFCESLSDVMFKVTGFVMMFAPIGIGAAMASTVGVSGLSSLKNLAWLVGTLYGALIAFILLILVPIALLARVPLIRFAKTVKEPFLLAFSTASSEAALPMALRKMEEFGVPKRIVSFVLPTGYSFNLDGSTLYLAVASMFAAQASGVSLSVGQQLAIMAVLLLSSKGIAAVPRASLIVLSATLASFISPPDRVDVILGLIMGVDALMDMARTSVNLLGNCLASAVMARWEGELADGPVAIDADESSKFGFPDEIKG